MLSLKDYCYVQPKQNKQNKQTKKLHLFMWWEKLLENNDTVLKEMMHHFLILIFECKKHQGSRHIFPKKPIEFLFTSE